MENEDTSDGASLGCRVGGTKGSPTHPAGRIGRGFELKKAGDNLNDTARIFAVDGDRAGRGVQLPRNRDTASVKGGGGRVAAGASYGRRECLGWARGGPRCEGCW